VCAAIKLEYNLFTRERNDGLYRIITYLLFKLLTELIITFIASLVFSVAVFYPLRLRGLWVYFWLNYLANLTTGIGEPLSFFWLS
jgi:ATP-binding cassette, subfamily G (WHITE), member 2